jgi:hypothetical protein
VFGNWYQLALDMTTPVSWIKGDNCKIVGTAQRCMLVRATVMERINGALRHKVTQLIAKLKMRIASDETDSAVIEGSNEIVMGSV